MARTNRKGVGGRRRSPHVADRDAKIAQAVLDLTAQHPDRLVKSIELDVGAQYGVGPSYVRRKVGEYRKKLGTDPAHPHKPTTRDEFNATVKLGQYFINPADQKLYQRTKIAL